MGACGPAGEGEMAAWLLAAVWTDDELRDRWGVDPESEWGIRDLKLPAPGRPSSCTFLNQLDARKLDSPP